MSPNPEASVGVDEGQLRLKQISALVSVLKYAIETSDIWADVRDLPVYATPKGPTVSKFRPTVQQPKPKPVQTIFAKPNSKLVVQRSD